MAKEEAFTLVMVGSPNSGKSSMTVAFLKGDYNPIEENYRRKFFVDGSETILEIIDFAGQQEYGSLRDSAFRSGQGFLLCFNANDANSLNKARELYETIKELRNSSSVAVVLVGITSQNDEDEQEQPCSEAEAKKIDEQARVFAGTIKAPYFQASALIKNFEEPFNQIVREMRKQSNSKRSQRAAKKAKGTLFGSIRLSFRNLFLQDSDQFS